MVLALDWAYLWCLGGWGGAARNCPSDSGSVMQQPGHTQGTWPATVGQGIGTEMLHWHRLDPSALAQAGLFIWGKHDNCDYEAIPDAAC